MYKKILIIFIITVASSCKNSTSVESLPSLAQSIEYITHKIDGREISTDNGVFTNIEFKVIDGRCIYKYVYISAKENMHYEIVELFYLKDISSVSSNAITPQLEYIKFNLNKKTNHRYSKSLNGRPLSHYGFTDEEWVNEAFVNVRSSDRESVLKAFQNIVKIQESSRASDYFENNN